MGSEHSVVGRASLFLIDKSFLLLFFKKEDSRLPCGFGMPRSPSQLLQPGFLPNVHLPGSAVQFTIASKTPASVRRIR